MSDRPSDPSELPDPLELFESMRRLAEREAAQEISDSGELPDPAELFRQMEQYRLSQAPSPEEQELPDPLALFEEMQRASEGSVSHSHEAEELPDPAELFEKMRRFTQPGPSNSSLSEDSPETKHLLERLRRGRSPEEVVDDIHLPLPGEERLPVQEFLQPPPPLLPEDPTLPYIPAPTDRPIIVPEAVEDETPGGGFFQRLKGRFKKPREAEPEPRTPAPKEVAREPDLQPPAPRKPKLPTPEELFRQMRAEREEAALNFELPQITRGQRQKGPLPTPEELFRRLEEESRPPGGTLPELPDLDALKAELEAEERARLDPDLLGDLAGPERFAETVEDSVFSGSGELSVFLRDLPPVPPPEPTTSPTPSPASKPPPRPSTPEPPRETKPPLSSPTGTVRVDPQKLPPEPPRQRAPLGEPPIAPAYQPARRPAAAAPLVGAPAVAAAGGPALKEPKPKRFSRHKLSIFTRQLAVMLKAGIQLHMAVLFAAESEPELNSMLTRILRRLESGYSFSAAIQDASRSFDTVYVGLVKAGEMSGRLHEMLERLADVTEREVELQKRIISIVTYPLMLLLVCFLGTIGFIFFVLPTLTPLFKDLGVDLPLPTRILLASRDFILPGAAALLIVSLLFYFLKDRLIDAIKQRPSLERRLARMPFLVPVAGGVYDKLVTARVLYSLSTMLDVGITLNQALAMAEATAGNAYVAYKLGRARMDLADGVGVTDCFRLNELFSPSALHLISAGEESARLSEMFAFVARVFDEEVEYSLQSAASILEPLIMVVMGVVVGFVTISAALPTITLLQKF